MNPIEILIDCLRESGDDVEAGFAAAEYILSSNELELDSTLNRSMYGQSKPKPVPKVELDSTLKDIYPRNHSGRFVDKYDIVDAAHDDGVHTALRDSIPQEQHWKLDKAVAALQGGGTVHHPSEPPGMAVDMGGGIADWEWARYARQVSMYEEWGERYETRKHCMSCLRLATRNLRSKDTQDFERINELLELANIGDRERRAIRRAGHRHNRGRITKDQLEDMYESVIEHMHRKLEAAARQDYEMEEPKAPGDYVHHASPAALAMSEPPPSSGRPRVMKRYGAKPGPGWTPSGMSRYGTPIWSWGAAQPKAPQPEPQVQPQAPPVSDESMNRRAEVAQIGTEPSPPPVASSGQGMTPPPIEPGPPPPAQPPSSVRQQPGPSPADTPLAVTARSLAASPTTSSKPLRGGANGSYKVNIDGMDAVWKPADEERYLRHNIDVGTYYRREAAAYSIASAVDIGHLVPVTVERQEGNRVGSVQQWVEGTVAFKYLIDEGAYEDVFSDSNVREDRIGSEFRRIVDAGEESPIYNGEDDLKLAAAFDYLIGNSDRHAGNWMLDNGGKLRLIDHGLAFPQGSDVYEIMSHLFYRCIDDKHQIPDAVASWDEQRIKDELAAHNIEPSAIEGVLSRLGHLKNLAATGGLFEKLLNPHDIVAPIPEPVPTEPS